MEIKTAKFIGSCTNTVKCPSPEFPEYAFTGRSNAGKSSLLNMLTNRKNIAKTSGQPGKTQTINHYLINNNFYFADLPGYGYAKIAKTKRQQLEKMIKKYIKGRKNLVCLFTLIDSRIPPQKIDIEFIEWLGINKIPFVILFTKTDKLSKTQLTKNLDIFRNELLTTWEYLPDIFFTSARDKSGKKKLLNYISMANNTFF